MSLHIEVAINLDTLLAVEVTRQTNTEGATEADAVNTYRWVYRHGAGKRTIGHVEHRYGDGAVALAAQVLAAVAACQAAPPGGGQ